MLPHAAIEIVSGPRPAIIVRKAHSPSQYRKVLDGRKQPICGLWKCEERIACISVEDNDGIGRTRLALLEGVETVAQAQEKLPDFGFLPRAQGLDCSISDINFPVAPVLSSNACSPRINLVPAPTIFK